MKSIRVIIFIWLAWAFIVIGFQALATARISVQYPDRAQEWTEEFTDKGYQEGHVFLLEPFMNNQVAWDSEYYLAIGMAACIATLKTHPELAWFSLAVVLISWGSGPAQGIHRYVLGAPAVFVALAKWGGNPVFDRAWTILSILLMGLNATLFAFNLWVA